MMMAQPSDENPEPTAALFDVSPKMPAPPGQGAHWYVDATDAPGYCAACALPRSNRRHVARRAA